MNLSFAEYLIEQNLLSVEQIVEAMLIQLKNQPSNTELVYELGVISESNFLKILLNQESASLDFISSAKNIGIWTKEIEDKLIKKIKNIEPKWGDILIQKGYIEFEKISSSFNSFIENKHSKNVIKQEKNVVIHSQMLKEYIDCFENIIYPSIQNSLLEIDVTKCSLDNINILLKKIEKDFTTAKAAADFVKAEKSLVMCNNIIKFINKKTNKESKEDIEKIKKIINNSLMILREYCKSLKKSQNESEISEEIKEIINQFNNQIIVKE